MELLDILKMGVPALLSFLFGRYLSSVTNKQARLKDSRQKLTELIRKVSTDSINYHSMLCDPKTADKETALIDHLLHQLRTDIQILKNILELNTSTKFAVREYGQLFNAITDFPYNPSERPNKIDANRAARISRSCEALVEKINS